MSVAVEALLPEVVESTAGLDATQSEDVFGTGLSPEHARLFAASADDGFTAGFDNTGADKQALTAEFGVAHTIGIGFKVIGRVCRWSERFLCKNIHSMHSVFACGPFFGSSAEAIEALNDRYGL